jgi:hypothetical protein
METTQERSFLKGVAEMRKQERYNERKATRGRPRRWIWGVVGVTLALCAWTQGSRVEWVTPAAAQEGGLDPDPEMEACETTIEEPVWESHASLHSFACTDGFMGVDQTSGAYTVKTIDPCNGDKTDSHTTSWQITDTEPRQETFYEGTEDEFTLTVNWYFVEEISDDGTHFYGEWKKGDRCCGFPDPLDD